jgi:hypothetical protein
MQSINPAEPVIIAMVIPTAGKGLGASESFMQSS